MIREKREDIHNNDIYEVQVMLGQNQVAIIAIVELFWKPTPQQPEEEEKNKVRMAAIIAQMTRAKRERDKKKTYVTEKCM